MLDRIKKKSPLHTISFIGIIYGVIILINPYKALHYGDVGLMYIQVHDIIDSGYSDFSIKYKGEEIDPEFKFFPYTKPFVGKINQKHYFVFPPYYLLINACLFQLFGTNGLYLLGLLSFLATLFLIYKLGILFELEYFFINLSILLYVFGMTASNYNFVFHELPFGIFWITASIYFAILYLKNQKDLDLITFGFLGAVSLFFRLEMIFVMIACGTGLILNLRKSFFKILLFSLLGFILPFSFLMISNYQIHAHPFGLRYLLNLSENSVFDWRRKFGIIYDLLFLKELGMFYQSPFLILCFLFPFFNKHGRKPERNFLFIATIIALVFILITSPNNGGHISPRYLFGIYPVLSLLSVICYDSLVNYFRVQKFEKQNSFLMRNAERMVTIIFILFILFSLNSTFKNFRWLQKASIGVANFNEKLESVVEENPIIFRDYSQPLNAQHLYLKQIAFVVEKLDEIPVVLKRMKSNGLQKAIVSQVFPVEMDAMNRSKVEETYLKGMGLFQKGDKFYFANEKIYVIFQWIDFGKNQSLLILHIFLN